MPSFNDQPRRMQTPGAAPSAPAAPPLLGTLSLLEPQYRWTRKDLFAYGTEFLTLGASTTTTNTIGIQGDTDFIVTFAMCTVTDSANTTQLTFIPQLVMLSDASSGMSFFNIPLHAMNVYGDAQNPGVFAIPRVLRAATSMSVQHQNLEATARNVRCAFMGFRSWPGTDTRDPRWQTG